MIERRRLRTPAAAWEDPAFRTNQRAFGENPEGQASRDPQLNPGSEQSPQPGPRERTRL